MDDVHLNEEQRTRFNSIVASAALDGMILDDEAKQRLAKVITGQLAGDEARAEILAKIDRSRE